MNPLVHYLRYGAAEQRDPGPFFDTHWYLTQHPELNLQWQALRQAAFPPSVFPGDGGALETPITSGAHRSLRLREPLIRLAIIFKMVGTKDCFLSILPAFLAT